MTSLKRFFVKKVMIKNLTTLFLVTITSQLAIAQLRAKTIVKHTNIESTYPYWSPDGSRIVFQSDRNDNDVEIYSMKSDGTDIRRLTTSKGLDETPIWSADGKYIVFASERDGNYEIYVMEPDGTNQTNISNHPAHDGHPSFSPDSKRIIFHSNRKMPASTYSQDAFHLTVKHDLYEMDVNGKNIVQVTNSDIWDTYPDISPDGRKIVFRRLIMTDMGIAKTNSEVFIAERDGSNALNLSRYPDHDGWPAFSPDGKMIAFASEREFFQSWQIYIMNTDGTAIRRITEFESPGTAFTKPQWSPDGKTLLCTRTKDGNVEIFTIELEMENQSSK
jgi:TolB protein